MRKQMRLVVVVVVDDDDDDVDIQLNKWKKGVVVAVGVVE